MAIGYGDMLRKLVNYHHLIIPIIKSRSNIDWFRNQNASWDKDYQVPFAEILTTRGYGFAFNIMDAGELLKTDQLKTKFHSFL